MRRWPHAHLDASEHYVGLPDGQMGNSEVGHTNLGAGRVVMQDLPRIDRAIADGTLAGMPRAAGVHRQAEGDRRHGACRSGLLSPGGVHSHQHQIAALAAILADAGVPVAVHAFLDGRDTPPKSAIGYLKQFQADTAGHGDVRIATVAGPLLRDGPRQALGPGREGLPRADRGRGRAGRRRGRGGRGGLRPRRDRRVRLADGDRRLPRHARTATACCSPISAPTASARSPARCSIPEFAGFARDKRIDFAAAVGLTEYSEELNRFLATLFPPEDLERHVRRGRSPMPA